MSNAAVLLFGGIETTDGMLANAIWHLLSNPDQLARVRADPSLVAAAVEESLRLEPAAAVVDRYATRDVELAGARIAQGDLVTVSLAGANRDPPSSTSPTASCSAATTPGCRWPSPTARTSVSALHLARLEARVAARAAAGALRRSAAGRADRAARPGVPQAAPARRRVGHGLASLYFSSWVSEYRPT